METLRKAKIKNIGPDDEYDGIPTTKSMRDASGCVREFRPATPYCWVANTVRDTDISEWWQDTLSEAYFHNTWLEFCDDPKDWWSELLTVTN